MPESIIVAGLHTLTIEEMIHLKGFVRELKDKFMTEGLHYIRLGEGDKAKPMLVKAGIEILMVAFRLSPRFEIKEREIEMFGVKHKECQTICSLLSTVNGAVIAQGIGLCSTLESRYRYVNMGKICPDCGKEGTIRKSKQDGGWYCWDKLGGCGAKWAANHPDIKDQVVGKRDNADIADAYNTVLKMANMRALRDAVMTGLSASDIFDDSEDFEVPDYLMTGKVEETKPLGEQSAAATRLMDELRTAPDASNSHQISEPSPQAKPESEPEPEKKVASNKTEAEPDKKAEAKKTEAKADKKPEPTPEPEKPSEPAPAEQSNFEDAQQQPETAPQPEPAAEEIDFDAKITADDWAKIQKMLKAAGKTDHQLIKEFGVERGSQLKKVDMPLIEAFINQ